MVIFIVIVIFNHNYENLTSISNESIQSIASLYNNSLLNVSNMVSSGNTTTNTLNVTNGAAFASPPSPNPSISLGTNKTTNFLQNAGAGLYNSLVNKGDDIIYTGGKNDLNIVPLSPGPSGIKITSAGTVGIGSVQQSSTPGSNPALQIGMGGNGTINFLNNASAGAYNPSVSSGDNVIFSSAGTRNTVPNLSIVPWSGSEGGITIKKDGSTTVNGPLIIGNRIIGPIMKDVRLTDGWDLESSKQSSINSCSSRCLTKYPDTVCGILYKYSDPNNTNCWCKLNSAFKNNANTASGVNTNDSGFGWMSRIVI